MNDQTPDHLNLNNAIGPSVAGSTLRQLLRGAHSLDDTGPTLRPLPVDDQLDADYTVIDVPPDEALSPRRRRSRRAR